MRYLKLATGLLLIVICSTSFKFKSDVNRNELKYFYVYSSCANCDANKKAGMLYGFFSEVIYANYNDFKKGQGAFYNQMTIDFSKEFTEARNGKQSFGYSSYDEAKFARQEHIADWKKKSYKIYCLRW